MKMEEEPLNQKYVAKRLTASVYLIFFLSMALLCVTTFDQTFFTHSHMKHCRPFREQQNTTTLPLSFRGTGNSSRVTLHYNQTSGMSSIDRQMDGYIFLAMEKAEVSEVFQGRADQHIRRGAALHRASCLHQRLVAVTHTDRASLLNASSTD